MTKKEILEKFTNYTRSTKEDLELAIELLDPIYKSDYNEFRILLDYFNTILYKLETCDSVRELMQYIDIDLLFESWDDDVFPYFNEFKYNSETSNFFRETSNAIEEFNQDDNDI